MHTRLSRRAALGMAAAAMTAVGGVRHIAAADATPVASPVTGASVDGIAGGGMLSQLGVDVTFSMMAVVAPGPDGEAYVHGFLKLLDPTVESSPVTIEARELISCEQLSESAPHGRRIIGWATMNGGERQPFVLQVEDIGEPGSGEDTFNLVLGEAAVPFLGEEDASTCNCSGFGYGLVSQVVSGDITILSSGVE